MLNKSTQSTRITKNKLTVTQTENQKNKQSWMRMKKKQNGNNSGLIREIMNKSRPWWIELPNWKIMSSGGIASEGK